MKSRMQNQPCSVRHDRSFPHPIRTFLAEDSPLLMTLLARSLLKDERVFIAGCATNGRKAIENAATLNLDLVVTDLHMPGLDGAEFTRRVKQRSHPPIVFVVTSDEMPEARARCLAAGADAFLVKGENLVARLLSAIQMFFPDDLGPGDINPEPIRASLIAGDRAFPAAAEC